MASWMPIKNLTQEQLDRLVLRALLEQGPSVTALTINLSGGTFSKTDHQRVGAARRRLERQARVPRG